MPDAALEYIVHKGTLIFETECSLKRFTMQIIHLFEQLRNKYGVEGFETKWGNKFPNAKLSQLKNLIVRRRINFLAMLF